MTTLYGSEAQPKKVFKEPQLIAAYYKALRDVVPGAWKGLKFIQRYWNPELEYHTWIMPDKHTVHIPQTETETRSLEIDELDHTKIRYSATVLKPQTQGRSLAANVIHSIQEIMGVPTNGHTLSSAWSGHGTYSRLLLLPPKSHGCGSVYLS